MTTSQTATPTLGSPPIDTIAPAGLGALHLALPLRPRVEEHRLLVRAEALVAALEPYARTPRIDVRFVRSVREIARVARGLAVLEGEQFAPEATARAVAVVEQMLEASEHALTAVRQELDAEPVTPRAPTRPRRPRSARAE